MTFRASQLLKGPALEPPGKLRGVPAIEGDGLALAANAMGATEVFIGLPMSHLDDLIRLGGEELLDVQFA